MRCGSAFPASALIILIYASILPSLNPASGKKQSGLSENELLSRWERARDFFVKGEDYFSRKDYSRAETELNSCLQFFPDHAGALFLLAQMDYLKGDFAAVLARIRKAEAGYAATSEAADLSDFQRRKKTLLDEKAEREREAALKSDAF
ncbi:MAG: hypothetical protein WAU81_10525, partial [Candidatus Aminicenantales bacterium]